MVLERRSREMVREAAVEEGSGVKVEMVRDWLRVSWGRGGWG